MRKVRNKNGVVPIGSGTTQSDSKLLNVVKYMMSKYSRDSGIESSEETFQKYKRDLEKVKFNYVKPVRHISN